MIRPARFGFNPETAATNAFQHDGDATNALQEFDAASEILADAGVEVHVFEDTPEPITPDAIFPNNWVSFHEQGAVLYPMLAPSRRAERRLDILEALGKRVFLDMTHHEEEGRFLEGTGSLVLERNEKFAFACISPRTDRMLAFQWCQTMGYRLIDFDTAAPDGVPIYHSNVVGTIGDGFAVVCREVIKDRALFSVFENVEDYEVVDITLEQMAQFCGNIIQLQGRKGRVIAMSQAAHDAFLPHQRETLSHFGTLIASPIPTIERLGGGSMRCMIAEVF